jgi:hypothetical protein
MSRTAMTAAFLACAILVALPGIPVSADMILPAGDAERGASAPGDLSGAPDAQSPAGRVGAIFTGDEWYEIPIGLLFMAGTAFGIYWFFTRDDD